MAALSFTPDWSGSPLPGLTFPEINQSEAGCIIRFSLGLISSTVSLGLVFSSVWLVLGHKILEFTAKEANMHVIFMSTVLGSRKGGGVTLVECFPGMSKAFGFTPCSGGKGARTTDTVVFLLEQLMLSLLYNTFPV